MEIIPSVLDAQCGHCSCFLELFRDLLTRVHPFIGLVAQYVEKCIFSQSSELDYCSNIEKSKKTIVDYHISRNMLPCSTGYL